MATLVATACGSVLSVAGLSALLGGAIEGGVISALVLAGLAMGVAGIATLFRHPEGFAVGWTEAMGRFPLTPRWPIRIVLLLLLVTLLVDRANNPGGPPRADEDGVTFHRQVTDRYFEEVDEELYQRLNGYQVAIAQLLAAVLALGAAAAFSDGPTTAKRRRPDEKKAAPDRA